MTPYWRRAAAWLGLLVVALGAASLRYRLIESSAIGELCSSEHGPAWCDWRQWLVLGFQHHAGNISVYGVIALMATALALLSKRPWPAWLAAATGTFALLLYCFEPGALALLIGCLRLLRLQAQPPTPPLGQHRQRDQ
ncbi:hypothetical protein [Rhodanobacter sp. C01]|uniref:hypothetical protein n=1 Tax=Rhodanobacter sp. C01 TaxID=1945856 RepID=UPI000985E361|nr:hypothetical protein [Rhodanobacter sp. C01]OOG49537.1 hypothetical protein B0E50_05340 [Rhodanobacter sp. C01]